MNFTPKMEQEKLLAGFKSINQTIYSSRVYYERLKQFLGRFQPGVKASRRKTGDQVMAFVRSVYYIGILSRDRIHYWKLFIWSLLYKPKMFPLAITYSIYGYHFRKVYQIR